MKNLQYPSLFSFGNNDYTGASPLVNLNKNDALNCSLLSNGRSMSSFCLTGHDNIASVFRMVKNQLSDFKGLITIILRNNSQGWSKSYSLYLR